MKIFVYIIIRKRKFIPLGFVRNGVVIPLGFVRNGVVVPLGFVRKAWLFLSVLSKKPGFLCEFHHKLLSLPSISVNDSVCT